MLFPTGFFSIGQPTALTASASSTNASCNGGNNGSITVTASGGTPGYQYALDGVTFQASNIFNGLTAGGYTITAKDTNGCTTTTNATISEPTPVTASCHDINTSCNGAGDGSITVTASGGTAAYQYSLDGITFQAGNVFNGLTAGSYTITVQDANNCATTTTATVNEPVVLTASAAATDALCNGSADGTITVTAAGGTVAYEYSVDGITFQAGNVFNGLTAGSYTITVRDNNGCTTTATATISEPSALTASATSTDATCNGTADGAIAVTAGGGTAAYEYSLDGVTFQAGNIFNGLSAGSYTITVRDANLCTVTTTATINAPLALTATVASTDASCNGAADGTVTVTASDGTPAYEYSLDGITFQPGNVFNGLTGGSYTITVRDNNGCTTTATATINEPAALTATAAISDISCNGAGDGSITVTEGGGTAAYQYSIDGVTFQAGNVFNGLTAGTYTITVQDANNCTVTTTATVNEPVVLTASATATDALCNGSSDGTITVTAAGGTTAYEYSLDGITFQPGNVFTGLSANTYTITVRDASGCTVTAPATINQPTTLTASATATDASCNGATDGTITVTAGGGTAAYEYSLDGVIFQASNVFAGVSANTYTITVRDANGCTATAPVTVNQPSALTASATATDATCNGAADGSLAVTAGGGTPGYEYSLDGVTFQAGNVFNGLTAGSYTITVRDNNGCTTTATATINEPAALTATAIATDISCNGAGDGSITVTASGGTAAYQYSLDGITFQSGNIFSGLAAGSYTITVQDANTCTTTTTASVNEPVVLTASATATDALCNGSSDGTITVTASGGTTAYEYSLDGVTFQPSNVFTGLLANTYTITVRDASGCTTTAPATINQPAALTASAAATDATCNGAADGSITVTAGGGTVTYEYSLDGITFQASNIFNGLVANNYTIIVRDGNNCTVTTTATINAPLALTASATATNAMCNGAADGTITVTATDGTPAYEYSLDGATFQASNIFTGLAANTYTITVRDNNGCTTTATATIGEPAALTATATASDISCNGAGDGSITVTAGGGTAAYQYSIDGVTFQVGNVFNGLATGTYTITVQDANNCTVTTTATVNEPVVLTASATATNALCNGSSDGAITVTATGGTTAYEYSLDGITFQAGNVFTGLSANTYTITVRDASGCTTTALATVNEPVALTASATATDASCNGAADGSITVTAGGGTAAYEYSLDGVTFQTSNVFNGFSAGSFTVTVRDANLCTVTTTVMIKEPVALTASAIATDAACNGSSDGTITVSAGGGTPGYEYSLDGVSFQPGNVFNGLVANTYTITVRDNNGCTVTTTATVNEPVALTATAAVTAISCNGAGDGSITVTAGGGTVAYQYSLDGTTFQAGNIFSGLAAGTYTITVQDANNCTTTTTATVNEPAKLFATATSTNVSCNGGADGTITVNASNGTPAYEYSLDGVIFQPGNVFNGLVPGNYSIEVRDINGCSITTTASITQPSALSLSVVEVNSTDCSTPNGTVDLTVSGGTAPYTFVWSNGATTEDISNLSGGAYSVTVTDAKGCSATINSNITDPGNIVLTASSTNSTSCISANGSIDLAVAGGVAPYTYLWDNGATTEDINNLSGNTYSVLVTDANGCTASFNTTITDPPAISLTAVAVNSTDCATPNGSVDLTVAGGTRPSLLHGTMEIILRILLTCQEAATQYK